MTQEEKQAVDEAAEAQANKLRLSASKYDFSRGFIAGAQFLSDLRKPCEPKTNVSEAGEDLVEKIELILNENRETDRFNRTALDWRNFHSVATEIAALMQPDKELLEALKKICRVAPSYIKNPDDELDNAICEAMLAVYNYELNEETK